MSDRASPDRRIRRDLVALTVVALIVRLATSLFLKRPGYMDAASYVDGALSLYDGRGFNDPFIWNYLDDPSGIPTPSHLYWMPLTSILAYLSFLLMGPVYRAAQVPFVLFSSLLPALSYLVAYDVAHERRHALCAGLFATFSGFYMVYWVTPDNFGPFALAGAFCLWAAGRARRTGRWMWFVGAGFAAGLAHLARADGILLAVAVLSLGAVEIVRAAAQGRPLRTWTLGCLGFVVGYVAVMGGWFLRNTQAIGRPLSTAAAQTVWLTDYDDLFSYGKPLTVQSYLAWGWGPILRSKLRALWLNAQTVLFVGWMIFMAPLGIVGVWRLRRRDEFRAAWLYGALLYLVMSLVFTFPGWRGGMLHSTVALLPFMYAAAMAGLDAFVDWMVHRRRSWQPRPARQVLSAGLVVFAVLLSGVLYARGVPKFRGAHLYSIVGEWMAAHTTFPGRVMVNDPASFYYYTRRECMSIPNADLDTVLDVMSRYGAGYLVLDDNYAALRSLYRAPWEEERLVLLQRFTSDGETVYLLQAASPTQAAGGGGL
jgi:hypothetical protein